MTQSMQPQLIGTNPSIPGVIAVDRITNQTPQIAVIGAEKCGKSTLATTLFGWPEPHMQPLILAWDRTGPDACLKMGYKVHALQILDQPGVWGIDKARSALAILEGNMPEFRKTYGSIVIDCASTMSDRFLDDARRKTKNPDSRSWYRELGLWGMEFMNRVVDLGLPTVWLAWLKPPFIHEEGKRIKMEMGTAQIPGQDFKSKFVGKAQQILYLEKRKIGVGQEGADESGYIRELHTRPYENVNCSGRYEHILPEPCIPNLGFILSRMTMRGPYAPDGR